MLSFVILVILAPLNSNVHRYLVSTHHTHAQSKAVPAVYQTELSGLGEGAEKQGCSLCQQYITRSYVLANLPSDTKDILKLLTGGFNSTGLKERELPLLSRQLSGFMCSMLGVWGSRTVNGKLFSARNLDWNKG